MKYIWSLERFKNMHHYVFVMVDFPHISVNISVKTIPAIMIVLGIIFIFVDLATPTNVINLFYVGILGVILFVLGILFYIVENYL